MSNLNCSEGIKQCGIITDHGTQRTCPHLVIDILWLRECYETTFLCRKHGNKKIPVNDFVIDIPDWCPLLTETKEASSD